MKKRLLDFTVVLLVLFYIIILITKPDICRNGTISGILLCGRVIIPSLFPFTMCVLFIINSDTVNHLNFISPFTKALTGFPADIFIIVLLSFVGGYPIGAKLLNNAVTMKRLTPNQAGVILNFCVNAGPAFIVAAVGNGILGSQKSGIILLCSHIISGIILSLISRFLSSEEIENQNKEKIHINPADNFVMSAAEASKAILSICGFIILFSSINAYIRFFGESVKILKVLRLILEVTNAVTLTDNIYLISFLLGFGGISVWCQVFAVARKIKINYARFVIFRILHGTLSILVTAVLLKLFCVSLPAFSNQKVSDFTCFYSSAALGISLLLMGIVFVISLSSERYTGKILDDVI